MQCWRTNPGNVQSSPGRVLYWPKAPRPISSMLWVPLMQHSTFNMLLIAQSRRDLVAASTSFHFSAARCCTYSRWRAEKHTLDSGAFLEATNWPQLICSRQTCSQKTYLCPYEISHTGPRFSSLTLKFTTFIHQLHKQLLSGIYVLSLQFPTWTHCTGTPVREIPTSTHFLHLLSSSELCCWFHAVLSHLMKIIKPDVVSSESLFISFLFTLFNTYMYCRCKRYPAL